MFKRAWELQREESDPRHRALFSRLNFANMIYNLGLHTEAMQHYKILNKTTNVPKIQEFSSAKLKDVQLRILKKFFSDKLDKLEDNSLFEIELKASVDDFLDTVRNRSDTFSTWFLEERNREQDLVKELCPDLTQRQNALEGTKKHDPQKDSLEEMRKQKAARDAERIVKAVNDLLKVTS